MEYLSINKVLSPTFLCFYTLDMTIIKHRQNNSAELKDKRNGFVLDCTIAHFYIIDVVFFLKTLIDSPKNLTNIGTS